jgi:hypothetical protein
MFNMETSLSNGRTPEGGLACFGMALIGWGRRLFPPPYGWSLRLITIALAGPAAKWVGRRE